MPWCPQCKTEYRDGFYTCANCEVELIEELIEPERERDELALSEDWLLLLTLNNEHEATIVESLLMAENIRVLKKYRDIGDYLKIYMGMSNLGIDIFVPTQDRVQAEEIIKTALAVDENGLKEIEVNAMEHVRKDEIEDNQVEENIVEESIEEKVIEDKEEMGKKSRTLVIILFTLIPALVYLVFSSLKTYLE